MRSNDKIKNNSYIIPGVLMSIVIIVILSSYGVKMVTDAKEDVTISYIDDTQSISALYEKEIYAIEKTADILANEIAYKDVSVIDDENIQVAKTYASTMKASNIFLVNTDFSAKDLREKNYVQINKMEQFKPLFDKKTDNNSFIKKSNGEEFLYVIKPVSTNRALKGYIIVEYAPRILESVIGNPRYSQNRTYALVSNDGTVIDVAGKETEAVYQKSEILKDFDEAVFMGKGSFTSFRQAIYDCRTGTQQILYKNEEIHIFYSPVTGTKAISMMLVNSSDIDRDVSVVSKSIRTMFIEIGVTIIVFFLIFFIIAMFNKAKYSIESEDLQNKADTDLLTDLYNKMATERLIKEYIEGEGKDSVSMLFILDVDDFKKINDTKGHAFGDQVLEQFGHQIKAWFRVNDIIGRVGGDEFMIFVKDVKNPEAIKREGSRIMQFFDGFNVGEYAKYSPTASVGGAVFPNDAKDFESLYKAADKAVYKSKKEGKNRVSFYSDLDIKERNVETGK